MKLNNTHVKKWVDEVSELTKPDKVVWFDGTPESTQGIINEMMQNGMLVKLNENEYPNCYLHRSHPSDVARSEKSTFICSQDKEDAGPLNNWMSPKDGEDLYKKLFSGCMKGKTMYVVPYIMGPVSSPHAQCGIEVTDSPYVVVNLNIMTRAGNVALEKLGDSEKFVRGLHSGGTLNPEEKYVLHFPDQNLITSINSNYGGNALLSKKCHALRLASVNAKKEGWLAEHMLLLEIEDPEGNLYYIAGAFPSASGKTNLAMMSPPEKYSGWKTRIIGDDIAWIHLEEDGRLYAINPENGFFGVAPNTSDDTNPNGIETIKKNSLFTNVALTDDGKPWWEGLNFTPEIVTDWKGEKRSPGGEKCAHPNSRFTSPLSQYPKLSPKWEDAKGVPITAIIFGGRRESVIPLIYESFNWGHGVFLGSTMGVEKTAAAEGKVGELRRDPMAMRPFCAYNVGDYFSHWLSFEEKSQNLPKIFFVNWFRKKDGQYTWPGFGDNIRVLEWIIDRCTGKTDAIKTEIGYMPRPESLNLDGLEMEKENIQELLEIDKDGWRAESENIKEFLDSLGNRVPLRLKEEQKNLSERLS